jgi:hypothetical protein
MAPRERRSWALAKLPENHANIALSGFLSTFGDSA